MFRGTYSLIFLFSMVFLNAEVLFAQKDEVDSVFKAYLETISPDSDYRAIRSLEIRYQAQDSIDAIGLIQYSQSPNLKASYTYIDSILVYKFSFDGVRVREKGPLSPESINPERIKLMEDLKSPFIELSDSDIAIYAGLVEIGDRQMHKIQLPNNTELYYDSQSHLKFMQISHIQSASGLIDQIIYYSDYKNYGGLLIPSEMRISVQDKTIHYSLTGYRINPELRRSIFN